MCEQVFIQIKDNEFVSISSITNIQFIGGKVYGMCGNKVFYALDELYINNIKRLLVAKSFGKVSLSEGE